MSRPVQLEGITWDHSRGFPPMVATAQRFHELHPEVEIHWSKRSLQAFADESLPDLAARFDLLVIDHPWAGQIAAEGFLVPLEQHLPAAFLEDQAKNSVGPSHASYQYDGHQWALAIDAATPVCAYRPDLLERAGVPLPRTFDEVLALGRRGLVCCPSIPLDVYGNFLNLLVAAGGTPFPNPEEVARRDEGVEALERLRQLAEVTPPPFFDLNPIRTLELMAREDSFAYAPYTYGYTNYARPGFAPNVVKFGEAIGLTPDRPGATMLGGTGLAISKRCQHLEVALEYVQFVASPETQRGLYFDAGGQPGHRSAWVDEELNARCHNFFRDTLPTHDRAFVRPRYPGYLDFQDRAGDPIHAFLREGGDAGKVLDALNQLYRESRR